jgi:N6-adenosine-specific RNA methylase IME4
VTLRITCPVCGRPFTAQRRSAITCSDVCRQRRSRRLSKNTPALPEGPFDLFCADPPWIFKTRSPAGQGRSPSRHYPTMDLTSLCRLPIANIAARDAVLAIWVYNPRLQDAFTVAAAWGFPDYAGVLFTWVKLTCTGQPAMGTGYSTRKCTEQCLLFRRGNGLRRHDCGVMELIEAPRTEHSRKPDEAMERLERLYGGVRRIELFARRARLAWIAWGNEVTISTPAFITASQEMEVHANERI